MKEHTTGPLDVALQIAGNTTSDPTVLRALSFSRSGARRKTYMRVKRAIDVFVTLIVAPAVLLVVAAAAVAILCVMGRPIFFAQDRVGLHGRVFRMYKLRSMTLGEKIVDRATIPGDPRITPLGALLRRTHLDELPQLFNIIVGDMTLIGPRPEQPQLVAYYRQHIGNYDQRHEVMPGLSGLAQVSYGYAADLEETRRKVLYDLRYVESYGPRVDLHILAETIRIYADPHYVR